MTLLVDFIYWVVVKKIFLHFLNICMIFRKITFRWQSPIMSKNEARPGYVVYGSHTYKKDLVI